jgi:4-amino-4-deoxy-L-arabinose transferase-like glycosyltransferase
MFVNLGGPPLWDRDEPRNAACAREMMERGDWVVPTFNDDLRTLKPAMKYWFMMVAYKAFGVSEFAARLPSAIAALLASWVTYFLGRRLFNDRVGLWSGIVLLTCLLFGMAGHIAKIDAALTMFSALGMLAYVSFAFTPQEGQEAALTSPVPQSWWAWVLVYAALGLAGLAKGLPGLFPAAVIGMFLLIVQLPAWEPQSWWQHGLNLVRPFSPLHFWRVFWSMRPLTGLLVVLAVAGPWYVAVGIQTDGEFLRGFFLRHHFGRAMEPMEDHSGPFLLYYLATITLGLMPWSVFLIPLGIWLVGRLRENRQGVNPLAPPQEGGPRNLGLLLLACWVGVYVVLFSCSRTKLPNYIMPCFPGLALLMGAFVDEVSAGVVGALKAWVQVALATLATVGVAVIVAPFFVARFVPGVEIMSALGAILAVSGAVAFVLYRQGQSLTATAVVAVSFVACASAFFGVALGQIASSKEHPAVCEEIRQKYPQARFATYGDVDPSWVFYATRPVITITKEGPGEKKAWTAQPMKLEEFVNGGEGRFLIARDRDWDWLRNLVPEGSRVVSEPQEFLRKGKWIVVECARKEKPTGDTRARR